MQTGETSKFVHEVSEVVSSVVAELGCYIVSSILPILYSDAFDVGEMKDHTRSAL